MVLLLQECMMGMLASKTVVYVTHKMESLPDADHILVTMPFHSDTPFN